MTKPDGFEVGAAAAAIALAKRVLSALPHRVTVAPNRLAWAEAISARTDEGSLLGLGLAGEVPGGAERDVIDVGLPEGPLELWAYRAGLKPVVFLTMPEDQVDPALALFPGAHVERRARRVRIEAHDRWVDRRDLGEARVELYISADAALALEASTLQASHDPSREAARLGELMGYPACCVRAFERQDDRSDNTRNRYATFARTSGEGWHHELNNLAVMLVPFFPCSYRCEAAREFARRTLEALRGEHPECAEKVEAVLRRPALYFAQDEVILFDGEATADTIAYERVFVPPGASRRIRRLAAALGEGDRVTLSAEGLKASRGGNVRFELERSDPALGFVAPFG
jgi:hypothetical protein